MPQIIATVSERELATILAALRYYQNDGLADEPSLRPEEIHDLATAGDTIISSLDAGEVDALCERLNFAPQVSADPASAQQSASASAIAHGQAAT